MNEQIKTLKETTGFKGSLLGQYVGNNEPHWMACQSREMSLIWHLRKGEATTPAGAIAACFAAEWEECK